MNNKILYQSNNYSLIMNNQDLVFNYNSKIYYLDSYPYEPCLYIKLNNKIIVIIHNSFNISEVIDIAKNNSKLALITGNDYDIKGICELLVCAINSNVFDTDISYLEKQITNEIKTESKNNNLKDYETEIKPYLNENLKELTDDIFYKEYKKYDECVLDYCIIKNDLDYNGEKSHKNVVIFAMSKWANGLKNQYDINITINLKKMKANKVDAKSFFEISKEDKDKNNKYWYLFLNPPHGCNYTINDFKYINDILFPQGYSKLEIFEWSSDWSNYFNDGLEWWGTKCVSIYDKDMNRFVVIGASAAD